MAEKISISVKEEREDVLEWIDKKVDEGTFQSRSHGFVYCAMMIKNEDVNDVLV